MFQRIKGAIDNTIAQEQARQRLSQSSPSRSGSGSHRSSSRNLSPGKRSSRATTRSQASGDVSAKGPDPSAFEPEFVIDDDELSRSGTPKPISDTDSGKGKQSQDVTKEDASGTDIKREQSPQLSVELPADVRAKLRKLEKLESRYHELLRSYRIAHARVQNIESFETSLRENTPLTSINDPNALVEYLNQSNLKNDMVVDELKRVSNERDDYKRKLSDSEERTKEALKEVAGLRNGDAEINEEAHDKPATSAEKEHEDVEDGDPLGVTEKSPPASIKSPTTSLRAMSIFSPRQKPAESPKYKTDSEDLFSYDGEIPRLETELQEKNQRIGGLERELEGLKGDLAVARESTSSMVQTLEEATRDVNNLRDGKERSESQIAELKDSLERSSSQLRSELQVSEAKIQELQDQVSDVKNDKVAELETQLQAAQAELGKAQSVLKSKRFEENSELEKLRRIADELKQEVAEAKKRNAELIGELERSRKEMENSQVVSVSQQADGVSAPREVASGADTPAQLGKAESLQPQEGGSLAKKKNKKKKKGGKSAQEQGKDTTESPAETASQIPESGGSKGMETMESLRQELIRLQDLITEKDSAIERLGSQMKDQEGLTEEIESLKDDLIHVGQEHVEAKEKARELIAEKKILESKIAEQQAEIERLQSKLLSDAADDEKHKALATQFEDLKLKASALQTDLSAAQQLASSRFKDLNDLRTSLQKAQPEINNLRVEAAELKTFKEALNKREGEFKRLDSKHEEMRAELTTLKQSVSKRDNEIKSLNQKMSQETSNRIKAEEGSSGATQELQRLETEKRQATESLDRLSKELVKAREDMLGSRARLKEFEQTLSKQRSDSEGLKEEVDLKSAQYASAQSLMASMRDQTSEMATQLKEARERCESLDEEVADAHRLLSERSREGETMRRLLADVEGRADARTREMKERMDTATEERDRAEDEAATAGRRKARELEELRNKLRDVERNLKRAEEDRDELEAAQKDWKRRREDLELRSGQSKSEADEVRKAMGELRDALDESEKQARDLEKQKAELRRSVEETQHRLEKLQKANKTLSDDLTKIQSLRSSKPSGPDTSTNQSSRSSIDSGPIRHSSPSLNPSSRKPSTTGGGGAGSLTEITNGARNLSNPSTTNQVHTQHDHDGSNGGASAAVVDYVYLKNVLLQFLEQKDKKHQMQLIPVLAMLLHFDRRDEQKWMSAVNAMKA